MDSRILRPSSRAIALILYLSVATAGIKHNFDRPVFVYTLHPDVPMARFAAGHIGIPEPRHARIYLFAAYRYLEGKPFSKPEQERWLNVWKARTSHDWPEWKAHHIWSRARKQLPIPFKDVTSRPFEIPQRSYTYGSICNEDAFANAARTLAERLRQFSATSAEIRFWVEGQDKVIEACTSATPQTFSAPPPNLPAILRGDREYHIAAATLYAQHFDEAAAAFRRIAQDPVSPWRIWAPYQAGRALLYKARTTQSDSVYNTALAAAEAQFRAVIDNPALSPSHTAAEYLYLRCLIVTNKRAALERIGRRLLRGDWAETDLALYLNGMGEQSALAPASWPRDAVSQWILTFQQSRPVRQPAAPAELYAALWNAKASAPDAWHEAALANGALSLRYVASYQLARKGQLDRARQILNLVIEELRELPSARNRALQLHTQLASSWPEFLGRAPRAVVLPSTEMDDDEWNSAVRPLDLSWIDRSFPVEARAKYRRDALEAAARTAELATKSYWDEAVVTILNERMSLHLLHEAANNTTLPAHLKQELALVVFTRAVLLNRWDIARSMAHRIPSPAIPAFMQNATEFTAAQVLLDFPGARPYVSYGYGRSLAATEHDEFARNWWTKLSPQEMYFTDTPYISDHRRPRFAVDIPLAFVTSDQAREAEQEWKILRQSGQFGLEWIASKIARAIEAGPARPGDAELLYRVHFAGRHNWWSGGLEKTPSFSRVARLLSTRYRSTKWFRMAAKLQSFEIPVVVE
jgi:hypothetical protein